MRLRTLTTLAGAVMLAISTGISAQQAAGQDPDPRWTWDLSDLFESQEAWDQARKAVLEQAKEVAALRGTLDDGPEALLAANQAIGDLYRSAGRVFVYASLGADENLGNPDGQERRQLGQQMFSEVSQSVSWYQPELIALGQERVESYLNESADLEIYRFNLMNALRNAPHTLGDEAEGVLAAAGLMQAAPYNIYGMLANSEIPFKTITLSTGEEVYINSQGYSANRDSSVRADRKAVFDAFWSTWDEYKGTAGQTLSAHLTAQTFTTRVRKYDDTLTRNLFQDNLPRSVYDALIRVTNDNLGSLHRYLELKARMLGLEDMSYYDLYTPMVEAPREFSIEETIELLNKAVLPLGESYQEKLTEAAAKRWMHVFPSRGKRSGAYMSGFAYDVHPYILLNHTDDYNSASTYAHEWGHAMHQVLANENQPFNLANFSIFTTEAAAIANELLLQDYMLRTARTDEERLYYLGYALEQIRTTFFRQTMFSEFEGEIYAAMERGEPLSGERITRMYGEIQRRYHGHDKGVVQVDDLYTNEWMFVPHFYFNFYVFQYATSISGAAYFTERLLAGSEEDRETYLEFLQAGGSEHPYDLFMQAGLDMASSEPYEALIRRMDSLMDDFEATLDRVETARANAGGNQAVSR